MQPLCDRALAAPRLALVPSIAAVLLASSSAHAGEVAAASVVPPPAPSSSPPSGEGPASAFPSGGGRPAPPPAAALDEDAPQPFAIGAQPAWFLLGGLSSGATVAGADRGGYVGGEVSLVRLVSGRSIGAYADAYYDFGQDSTYAGAGVELGWKILALDGGFAARFAGETDLGGAVRLCATVGLFSLCGRYTHFSAERDRDLFQVGALLKVPLMSPLGDY
jgi:hypothetical protein